MKERKFSLSVRALTRAEERENIRQYSQKTSQGSRATLGDLLAEKLKGTTDSGSDSDEDK
jgi:ribosomal protein S1